MKIKTIGPILFFTVFLVTGCKIVPTNAFLRTGPSYASQMPEVAHLSLATDAVVQYVRVTTNYIVLKDSQFAATNMLLTAKQFLEKKGYQVSFSITPFVGAFENPGTPMSVAEERKNSPTIRYPPFYISDSLKDDEPYRRALTQVIAQAAEAVIERGALPTETFLSDSTITNSLRLIAEKEQTHYLMIIVGNGTSVSEAKQMGQMFGTALVSTVLTAGFVTAMRYNVSCLDSYAALIDLKTGEILWSNLSGLSDVEPAEFGIYRNGEWATQLLYHFPDRKQIESH
jgi:hypothetical protein